MFRCPNCGLKASGDYCQWCHYPILSGVPKKGRKSKKQEAIAAKEKKKQDAIEAKKAKEAEKQAKKEAKLATEEEKGRKTEEVGGAELYEGEVKLMIVSPVDLGQMKKLQEYLRQIQDLDLVMVSGSVDEGTAIFISAVKPIPLIDILREMSPVEQVVKEGTKIQIMLKAE